MFQHMHAGTSGMEKFGNLNQVECSLSLYLYLLPHLLSLSLTPLFGELLPGSFL